MSNEQPRSDFELVIRGDKFGAFTSGNVTRRLDSAADAFQFDYADLRLDLDEPAPIRVGDACEIRLRDQLILTGYVDDLSIQYDADRLRLTARGRSKTGDLVDCSAIHRSGRFRNKRLDDIARTLCKPFGIDVTTNPNGDTETPFPRFAIEPGESVIDTILRASKARGVWPTNTVQGGLLLTAAASGRRAGVTLKYGDNIIRGERYDSWLQRHDQYLLKGQVPSDDDISGREAAQIAEEVADEAIDRYRPLLLVSTASERKGDIRRRALWERNRRAGTGERFIYRVDGFGYESTSYGSRVSGFNTVPQRTFRLWEPNMEVMVDDPRLGVKGWYLISAVTFRWDAEGTDAGRATDLTLVPKEAFTLDNFPVRR